MVRYRQVMNLNASMAGKKNIGTSSFLYFKENISLYVYNRLKDLPSATSPEASILKGSKHISLKQADADGNMIYSDFNAGILELRQLVLGHAYLSEEPVPKIHWILVNGEKNIGIFRCKKALTHFRGRDYIAWYTPDIPLKYGPWKLYGLPGLILEAIDQSRQVYFQADSITIPYATGKELVAPGNGKRVPFKEFKTIEYEYSKRLLESLQSIIYTAGDNRITFDYNPLEIFSD